MTAKFSAEEEAISIKLLESDIERVSKPSP
jgi:hypothetical protein